MTPEERITKIENLLQALTESQVQFQVDLQQMTAQFVQHEAQIEKQNEGIRGLIVVNRTFLESQKEVSGQIQELGKAQSRMAENLSKTDENLKETTEKLNALIDIVDRITRRDEKS